MRKTRPCTDPSACPPDPYYTVTQSLSGTDINVMGFKTRREVSETVTKKETNELKGFCVCVSVCVYQDESV